jgi:hypothetical protein
MLLVIAKDSVVAGEGSEVSRQSNEGEESYQGRIDTRRRRGHNMGLGERFSSPGEKVEDIEKRRIGMEHPSGIEITAATSE